MPPLAVSNEELSNMIDNNNWRKRFEEKFTDTEGHFGWQDIYPSEVKAFITSELASLLMDILGKEYSYVSGVTHLEDNRVVSVGDILAAARKRGIDLQ